MLQQQGFGTRKECSKLVQEGLVLIGGKAARDANAKIEVYDGMKFGLGEDEFEYRCVFLRKNAAN